MQIFLVLTAAPFGLVTFSPPRPDTPRTRCRPGRRALPQPTARSTAAAALTAGSAQRFRGRLR